MTRRLIVDGAFFLWITSIPPNILEGLDQIAVRLAYGHVVYVFLRNSVRAESVHGYLYNTRLKRDAGHPRLFSYRELTLSIEC